MDLGSREGRDEPHVPRSGSCPNIPKEFCVPALLLEIPAGIPAGISSVITTFLLGSPDSCWHSQIPAGNPASSSSAAQIPHPKSKPHIQTHRSRALCPVFPQSHPKSPIPDPGSRIPALQGLVGLSFFWGGGGTCSKFWGVVEVGEGSRCGSRNSEV